MIDGEQKPRVWVGDGKTGGAWLWCQIPGACGKASWIDWGWIEKGQVFVPPGRDRPTIDPSEMKSMETCSKVDWDE